MLQFSKNNTIASRVQSIIKSDIEARSEEWLVGLGYADCNDYAQTVVGRASYTPNGIEHVRFETVARYVRTSKASIRAKLVSQAKQVIDAALAQLETAV